MRTALAFLAALGFAALLTPFAGGLQDERFEAVDLYLDSGSTPLAAWQLEISDPSGRARVVGIEGGEHASFRPAPYHDPAAIDAGRVVVAAFSTESSLPRGETRVARIHFVVRGATPVDYAVALHAAADANGTPLEARWRIR